MKNVRNNEGVIQYGGTINVGTMAVGPGAHATSLPPAPPPVATRPSPIPYREERHVSHTTDWDAFISHASEDKDFVEPLVRALVARGLKIWYDNDVLKIGGSIREGIDFGLANSRFGIVVLSPYYFAKDWTRQEVNGLFSRETGGKRVVLPIWHRVTIDEVRNFSHILAERIALRSSEDLDTLAEKLLQLIR